MQQQQQQQQQQQKWFYCGYYIAIQGEERHENTGFNNEWVQFRDVGV